MQSYITRLWCRCKRDALLSSATSERWKKYTILWYFPTENLTCSYTQKQWNWRGYITFKVITYEDVRVWDMRIYEMKSRDTFSSRVESGLRFCRSIWLCRLWRQPVRPPAVAVPPVHTRPERWLTGQSGVVPYIKPLISSIKVSLWVNLVWIICESLQNLSSPLQDTFITIDPPLLLPIL